MSVINNLNKPTIVVKSREGETFQTNFKDLFSDYLLPDIRTDADINRYKTQPLNFYQNQLNFAVWCATSGCGVGLDILSSKDVTIANLFKFHVYFTIRKILELLKCPIPGDNIFNPLNNNIDHEAYVDTCRFFNVDQHHNWKQTVDKTSGGLGTAYYGGGRVVPGKNYDDHILTNFGRYAGATYMGFGLPDPPKGSGHSSTYTVEYIRQSKETSNAWTTFIKDKTSFTEAGIIKINETVRTFVFSLLGAQAQTKTSVLTPGTGLDARRQFAVIVEDVINTPIDIEASINRFQDSLQYAKSSLNFVIAPGIYLMPSDMELRVGVHEGYNNNIQIATTDLSPGLNLNLNSTIPQPPQPTQPPPPAQPTQPIQPPPPTLTPRVMTTEPDSHEDEKTALTVGILVIAGVSVLMYKIMN